MLNVTIQIDPTVAGYCLETGGQCFRWAIIRSTCTGRLRIPQAIRTLGRDDSQVTFSLTDFDVDPFDVTKREDVDVSAPLSERSVGGLGIHLVKKIVDKIEYQYDCDLRQSKITLFKKLK